MMKRIVFYDGQCGFCNRVIALVLKNEKTNDLMFASLQSDFTKQFFQEKKEKEPSLNTFILFKNETFYYKSTASLQLLSSLKWPWQLFHVFWLIPRFIRNFLYDIIAKNRHKLGGNYCFIPSNKERSRFLEKLNYTKN